MDIAEKIEDAKQSDALLLIVFYTDIMNGLSRYFMNLKRRSILSE